MGRTRKFSAPMHLTTKYRLSLGFNILMILLIIAFAIHKREQIIEKFTMLTYNSPTESTLSKFNSKPLGVVNDSVIIPSANDTLRILFLGNSITLHGIVEDMLPCKAERGMMATSPQKDYVHQVSTHLAVSNQLNVKFSIINIASFERSFPEHSFDIKLLSKAMVSSPDILVVQIGENVSEESIQDPALFEKRYTELLNLFPNSIRFITIPFWPSMQKQYAITNVAIRSKSYLVDLSHLGDGTDMTNFASSYKRYKVHPKFGVMR